VSPLTASANLSSLRRRARIIGDLDLLSALCEDVVLRLVARLCSGTKASKTGKRPILVRHIREAWQSRDPRPVPSVSRNFCLLAFGLFFGLRRRELVALNRDDVTWNPDDGCLTLRVCSDKTNRNVVNAQRPRVLTASNPLLSEIWLAYLPILNGGSGGPLFGRLEGGFSVARLAPASVSTIVREVLPGLGVSPHSLRVGFATEAYAAGVPLTTIMEMGRWRSSTALLYILPSADRSVDATRRFGSAAPAVTPVEARRGDRGSGPSAAPPPAVSADQVVLSDSDGSGDMSPGPPALQEALRPLGVASGVPGGLASILSLPVSAVARVQGRPAWAEL
jgi:integrase